jgi:hypothetical protein
MIQDFLRSVTVKQPIRRIFISFRSRAYKVPAGEAAINDKDVLFSFPFLKLLL